MRPCPKCHSAKHTAKRADGLYWCNRCRGLFDDDPNEGGDYSTFNPAARLDREDLARAFRGPTRKAK